MAVITIGCAGGAGTTPVRLFRGLLFGLVGMIVVPLGAGHAGAAPEIDIQGNGVSIAAGDTSPGPADGTDFGAADILAGTVSRTFTVSNAGDTDLNLGGTPVVEISGTDASDFTVTAMPSSPVGPGGGTTFDVVFDPGGPGTRTATLSIANDDPDENPYTFTIQGTGTVEPEIDLRGNGTSITSGDTTPGGGDHTDFGPAAVGGGGLVRTFTVVNTGSGDLNLTGTPAVSIAGAEGADFTVTTSPGSPVSAGGGTTTFDIRFDPGAPGIRTGTVSIANDDRDENPYTFTIQGTGTAAPTVSTDFATSVSATQAFMNGHVIPNGLSTQVWFVWGRTTAYENGTVGQYTLQETGFAELPVGPTLLPGLTPGTTYHYAAAALNAAGGTVYGQDSSFTTLFDHPACPGGEPPVDIIPGSYSFGTLQAAFATAGDSDQIRAVSTPPGGAFREDLVVNVTGTVDLTGGYACGFAQDGGWTEILGSLSIDAGILEVEHLAIGGCSPEGGLFLLPSKVEIDYEPGFVSPPVAVAASTCVGGVLQSGGAYSVSTAEAWLELSGDGGQSWGSRAVGADSFLVRVNGTGIQGDLEGTVTAGSGPVVPVRALESYGACSAEGTVITDPPSLSFTLPSGSLGAPTRVSVFTCRNGYYRPGGAYVVSTGEYWLELSADGGQTWGAAVDGFDGFDVRVDATTLAQDTAGSIDPGPGSPSVPVDVAVTSPPPALEFNGNTQFFTNAVPGGAGCSGYPCTDFGVKAYSVTLPAGLRAVRFVSMTQDWENDLDLIVMRGAIPPVTLHPWHAESPTPDRLDLHDPLTGDWEVFTYNGHQYWYQVRHATRNGSDETVGILNPPAGTYYLLLVNTSIGDASMALQVSGY